MTKRTPKTSNRCDILWAAYLDALDAFDGSPTDDNQRAVHSIYNEWRAS
jgi:hypothetical protein